jgi:hypothetical protein
MKNKPKDYKSPAERLETLASVAGRNLPQAIVSEMLEQEKRIERLERLVRDLLNRKVGQNQANV